MTDKTSQFDQCGVTKLPVFATVRETCATWFGNLETWLTLMILPSVAIVAVTLVLQNVSISSDPEVDQTIASPLLLILMFVIGVPAITAWHRLTLRSEDRSSGRYRRSRREFCYAALHIRIWVAVTVLNGVFFAIVFNLFPLILLEFGDIGVARHPDFAHIRYNHWLQRSIRPGFSGRCRWQRPYLQGVGAEDMGKPMAPDDRFTRSEPPRGAFRLSAKRCHLRHWT